MDRISSPDDPVAKALLAPVAPVEPELARPFDLIEPDRLTSPLVFSSPHSGDIYPQRFLERTRLDSLTLRRSEDAHVDALFAAASSVGAPMLKARFPRAYLDLNREPYELDPKMFDSPLPGFANTRSLRVAAGLGTIPRVVADAREIYADKLGVDEAIARVESLYKPYHAMLRALMERARSRFGVAILVDCHSMPSALARDPALSPRADKRGLDFVIGDRFGASCAPALVETIERELAARRYFAQRNRPYAGGFITEHYGKPGADWHALQIEVARSLYMNESTLQRSDGFGALQRDVTLVVEALAAAAIAQCFDAGERRAAAE